MKDNFDNIPLISPKPCRTPTGNRVRRFNFQFDANNSKEESFKSAKTSKNTNINDNSIDNLSRVYSSDYEKNSINKYKTTSFPRRNLELDSNFEKHLEECNVNDELLFIINSNLCSPSQTNDFPNVFMFNSNGSNTHSTQNSEDQNRISIPPCRTKNPFYKNFEDLNINEINENTNILGDLSKCKSID